MPVFKADFEFLFPPNTPGTGTSSEIAYSADDEIAAVEGAVRFWTNRHRTVPGHFHTLLAVKVWRYDVQPIAANGELMTRNGLRWFEWKIDFPGTLAETVAAFKARQLQLYAQR